MQVKHLMACAVMGALLSGGTVADAASWGLKKGNPQLKSAGPLAFGPDGILLVGDTKAATVFAIETGDTSGDPDQVRLNVDALNRKVSELVGSGSKINDLVVNPLSGNVYLSVATRIGSPALVRVDVTGKLSKVSLKQVAFAKVALPNPPADKVVGKGRRKRNRRNESITDLTYFDGKILVSGLSGGKSPSTVREIRFPFRGGDTATSIEIYHGAHGKVEDSAAIRAFVPFNIDGKPNLLAGFTCTPLVKFPLASLESGKKIRGTTVAELGNRNKPLDMIVYKKDGESFVLMANSNRGVMKISTKDIERSEGITTPIRGGKTAGQTYETIEELQGVVQLDLLNDNNAVILVQTADGTQNLQTIALP
jgi:hypothetical protein